MLYLETLRFEQFKNYASASFGLCAEVNCFTGNNGAGKTNILDAIHYLSFTKSAFNPTDQQHIRNGEGDFFFMEGKFNRNGLDESVRIAFQKGRKKSVKVNNNEHPRIAEHIGLYPLVMIAPNDIMLIHEGSEERRRFMDSFIAQLDKVYLTDLMNYNRVLEQRNKQLRIFAESGTTDVLLLQTYNEQLIRLGTSIHLKRVDFLTQFIPVFGKLYEVISGASESVDLVYESALNQIPFSDLLLQSERNDLAAQRTTQGIHKDELVFTINQNPLRKFGSQGQQKSFIIALKLAQYQYLKQKTGIKPLLLLDDIFEKLDENRLKTLLAMIAQGDFGQLFITDTHLHRLQEVFTGMPLVQVKYFHVDAGSIAEL
jgi:DNA replication and repair protein RecF